MRPYSSEVELDESYFGPKRVYAKHRLAKFKDIPKHIFRLHLKETEFRFNHRRDNLYKIMLKLLRNSPI